MIFKKTVLSSNFIICILLYVLKLRQVWRNQHGNEMDKNTERLLFMKKMSELGMDLVSKNFISFIFHLVPHSSQIIHSIQQKKHLFKIPPLFRKRNL